MTASPFDIVGPAEPASPVVISVPHAGRDYPPALRASLAVPASRLTALEDRYVDAVALASRADETLLVQRLARAWIDLNRSEDERDPRIDQGAAPLSGDGDTAKLRSGLGLVPRRAGSSHELWQRRFSDADIRARIAQAHRPYHDALATLLSAARDRWGVAVLLDVHSMPSLGKGAARIVIGDRFGRAAGSRFVARVEAEVSRSGLKTAFNAPYPGGHILQRHGAPAAGIHAVQLEIDRSLYLDASLDKPGDGFGSAVTLLRGITAALADEAVGGLRQAAE